MDELVAFLRARIAEDTAVVRALAEPHDWRTGPGDDPEWADASLVCMWPPEHHTPYEQDKHWRGLSTSNPELAAYIARHDPARALAEVEAKRRLLDLYERIRAENPANRRSFDWEHAPWRDRVAVAAHAVRLIAAVYSDHPNYDEEWRP